MIKKIILDVGGQDLILSYNTARELYNDLRGLFALDAPSTAAEPAEALKPSQKPGWWGYWHGEAADIDPRAEEDIT